MAAFKFHYRTFAGKFQLESYVDDVFGGAISLALAENLKSQLIAVGKLTTAVMNLLKCKGPSQILPILGHQYDALSRSVNLSSQKQQKYLTKLRSVRSALFATSKELESLLGYLS